MSRTPIEGSLAMRIAPGCRLVLACTAIQRHEAKRRSSRSQQAVALSRSAAPIAYERPPSNMRTSYDSRTLA